MAIYFNEEEYPYIFKNEEEISEPNQSIANYDFWSVFAEEQKRVQSRINKSVKALNHQLHQQELDHKRRWRKIYEKLNEQRKYNEKHKEFKKDVKGWLENIESQNVRLQAMLNEESLLKQEMIEKWHSLQSSYQEIERRLEKQEAANEQLLSGLHEQHELQKEIVNQISKQEERYQEVIERLENQEALTEKVLRQVINLRSAIFERAGHLAEKIENGYKLTSSYIYKLMTGSVQPLQVFQLEQKEKQKKDGS